MLYMHCTCTGMRLTVDECSCTVLAPDETICLMDVKYVQPSARFTVVRGIGTDLNWLLLCCCLVSCAGGIDPSIRPEVWRYLFGIYPFNSTER